MDMTGLTLFGRARYQVLACLFALAPNEDVHLREIARRAGLSPTAVQYELRLLHQIGLVQFDGASRRPRYRIDFSHPVAREVRAIIRKTNASSAGKKLSVADAVYWAGKRVQQAQDYSSPAIEQKSPFLAERKKAGALKVDYSTMR
jgi:predicted transcriptional regulator